MIVKFKKLNDYAKEPVQAHDKDFCYDVYATSCDEVEPGVWRYGLGLAFEIKRDFESLGEVSFYGSIVNTPEGKGTVEDVEVLREIIKVKIEKDGNFVKKNFKNTEIEVLKVGRRREKQDEEVNMKELKALEEGFKREDI